MITLPQIYFGPMEGITDEVFRLTILELYPEWDYMATDFLRYTKNGIYPSRTIFEHYGKTIFENEKFRSKNYLQVLTCSDSLNQELTQKISSLGFHWIDLNLGCPSKTVSGNKGGSFLLSDLLILRPIIKILRQNISGKFSCKIRLGYHDKENFENIVHLLNDEGVDLITIHGRTKSELYLGRADWNYLKRGVQISHVPIVVNGDIWTLDDIGNVLDHTGAQNFMMSRGALKTPWMAKLYKSQKTYSPDDLIEIRKIENKLFLEKFIEVASRFHYPESSLVKRLKSVARYLFDDYAPELRNKLLLCQNLEECRNFIRRI